jgi:hypothetical protein
VYTERTPTRKDRNTVLALTAKERTAATKQMTRSDLSMSFWKEETTVRLTFLVSLCG